MSTYLGDPEQDKWIAEMKAEQRRREIQDDAVFEYCIEDDNKRLLDCDGDTMIGDIAVDDNIILNLADPAPADNAFRFMLNEPTELFRIEQTEVGGDVRLEAGRGAKEDGDIYFTASGKTLSLTNLLEIVQSLGYDHLIEDANDQEVHCDFEGAMSILGK